LSIEISSISGASFTATVDEATYGGFIAGDPRKPDEKGIATMFLNVSTIRLADEAVHFSSIQVFEEKANGTTGRIRGVSYPVFLESAGYEGLAECKWNFVRGPDL
jgi:hypothetical protein